MSRPFADGDEVLLVDAKKRRYLVTLAGGGEFHTHAGVVAHDDVIGAAEGAHVPLDARLARSSPFGRPWPTSCSRCPAVPRSSTPRIWGRS